jgi:hypothetical protein
VGKFPTDPSSYTVQYSRFLTTNSLPIPPDSGFVEFDGSTQPYLVATTKMNLTQAREFYEKQLVAQGWLPRAIGRSIKKDVCRLPFIQGEQDLSLGLVSQPNGRTLVRVGDRLEDSSWQLARPKPAAKTVIAPIGIQAADFPLLNPSKSADFNPDAKSIELKMGAVRLSEVADQYTKELESKGWTTKGTGIRSDDYVFLTFSREKAEIELRARLTGGEATLNVQGDGILWTKPLPGGQQVISYETWLRRNQRPASLELLDEYVAAMRAIATARPAGGK